MNTVVLGLVVPFPAKIHATEVRAVGGKRDIVDLTSNLLDRLHRLLRLLLLTLVVAVNKIRNSVRGTSMMIDLMILWLQETLNI